jgi:hypothetical protein
LARYNSQLVSATAVGVDTAFGWFGYLTTVAKLRRVTLGIGVTSGSIVSQQCVVGFNVTTGALGTPTKATANAMDAGSPASTSGGLISAAGTPPTLGATTADAFKVAFNTQSGADLPWEQLEEWRIGGSTSLGIAFVNRVTALPANHEYILSVEFEE